MHFIHQAGTQERSSENTTPLHEYLGHAFPSELGHRPIEINFSLAGGNLDHLRDARF